VREAAMSLQKQIERLNKVCPKCGKKAADDYRPLATKYPDGVQV